MVRVVLTCLLYDGASFIVWQIRYSRSGPFRYEVWRYGMLFYSYRSSHNTELDARKYIEDITLLELPGHIKVVSAD